jgi:hypothetical protein
LAILVLPGNICGVRCSTGFGYTHDLPDGLTLGTKTQMIRLSSLGIPGSVLTACSKPMRKAQRASSSSVFGD